MTSNEIYEDVTLSDGSVIEEADIIITEENKGFILQSQEVAINVCKNTDGTWEEEIDKWEEKPLSDEQVKVITELLETEVKQVEEDRVYISSKNYGNGRFHIASKEWDGDIRIDQIVTGEKYPAHVVFAPDEVPLLLKTLLKWYLVAKSEEAKLQNKDEILGAIDEMPF